MWRSTGRKPDTFLYTNIIKGANETTVFNLGKLILDSPCSLRSILRAQRMSAARLTCVSAACSCCDAPGAAVALCRVNTAAACAERDDATAALAEWDMR